MHFYILSNNPLVSKDMGVDNKTLAILGPICYTLDMEFTREFFQNAGRKGGKKTALKGKEYFSSIAKKPRKKRKTS